MNHVLENKREFERFELSFPATVATEDIDDKLQLKTENISAGGVFLKTGNPFDEGTPVTLEIVISNETLKKLTGYESCIKVAGTVVRCDKGGMAVSFKDQKIMPLRSIMDH
jgi:hypothetical protein